MIILSIHFGGHDTVAAVADDYSILSAVQAERLTRIKGDGRINCLPQTIGEALCIADKNLNDVDVLLTSRAKFYAHHHIWTWGKTLEYAANRLVGIKKQSWLSKHYQKVGNTEYRDVLKVQAVMKWLGLSADTLFFDYNHHFAHALSALFFTDWQDALLYTADGGGDWVNYSARHLKNGKLYTLYGGDEEVNSPTPVDSIGLAYGYMTQALGYKKNRHEGKLTGLAAYGKPTIYNELAQHFLVTEDGRINSNFTNNKAMKERIICTAKNVKPEDAAASIQKLLEDLILRSIDTYLKITGAKKIGLAGGVFANVTLNSRIVDVPEADEVFIFPGMGDEGIAIGGLFEFLLKRDGLQKWLEHRHRINHVYWGGTYDNEAKELFAAGANKIDSDDNPATIAARFLADGKIVAIYHGRMEFGPRALGARSILASPTHSNVNQVLNDRLQRTEFMPFAPCVLEEDADDVFDIIPASRYAMCFMTITCKVKQKWRKKIPAVVHVDGTARPQIINEQRNPLYANVLRNFKKITGLPVLVNTSLNAHEEPIIYKPSECLRALNERRIDYMLLSDGIYSKHC